MNRQLQQLVHRALCDGGHASPPPPPPPPPPPSSPPPFPPHGARRKRSRERSAEAQGEKKSSKSESTFCPCWWMARTAGRTGPYAIHQAPAVSGRSLVGSLLGSASGCRSWMQVLDAYALDAYALDAHTLDIEGDAVCACPRGPICSKGKRERGKEKKKKRRRGDAKLCCARRPGLQRRWAIFSFLFRLPPWMMVVCTHSGQQLPASFILALGRPSSCTHVEPRAYVFWNARSWTGRRRS